MGIAIMPLNKSSGFTLIEILVALMIFTIIAMMMTGALRTVIDAQSGAERNAERLRELQIVLVRMSRDIEQTVNRPVKTKDGHDASAFFGSAKGFAFTHGGLAGESHQQQVLQRTQYLWSQNGLWRLVWDVLDQAANSPAPKQRLLIPHIIDANFEYLDEKNTYHKDWPTSGNGNQILPKAVKMNLTIEKWGKLSQTYVIPAQVVKATAASPPQS